jgi:GTP pyrophosphokinase
MQLPLRSELKNGDIVEVVTSTNNQPNPGWLAFVRTGKARASIRHSLKTKHYGESLQLGERLLANALRQQGVDAGLLSGGIWEKLLHWTGDKTREEACVNIALGRRSHQELAIRLKILLDEEGGDGLAFVFGRDGFAALEEFPCSLQSVDVLGDVPGARVWFDAFFGEVSDPCE